MLDNKMSDILKVKDK